MKLGILGTGMIVKDFLSTIDKLDIEESLLAARVIAMELGALLNRFTFWTDVTELLKGDKNLDAMREMWAAKVQEAKEQLYGE